MSDQPNPPTKRQYLTACYTLAALAIAQPIFDLLGKQAEFFVAHQSRAFDILFTTFLVSAVVPLILALPGIFFGARVRRFVVALLAALLLLIVLVDYAVLPASATIGLAALGGALFAGYGYPYNAVKTLTAWMLPAALVFPLVFLFFTPVKKLILPQQLSTAVATNSSPIPVVMLIFDELPLLSLLDQSGEIDRDRYPNLYAFSQTSLWYPNATTVAEHTLDAIPAVLTGRYPDQKRLPHYVDHPQNLFTILAGSHDLGNVNELMTSLCPASVCWNRHQLALGFGERALVLLTDIGIVYAHLVIPDNFRSTLPAINTGWGGFLAAPNAKKISREEANNPLPESHPLRKMRGGIPRWYLNFLDRLDQTDKPGLHFTHIMLPHFPWRYLPDGREYLVDPESVPGLDIADTWENTPGATLIGQRRHLLQVGLVDNMIGELITRLRDTGLFDDALVIVTADHGASFRPGSPRRRISPDNASEILYVPLLIKPPHMEVGVKDLRQAELIDVLPTIADFLNIELHTPVDGQSLLQPALSRTRKTLYTQQDYKRLEFPLSDISIKPALQKQIEAFGEGSDEFGLFRHGKFGKYIGSPVAAIGTSQSHDFSSVIDQTALLDDIDPTSNFVPAHITGQVIFHNSTLHSSELLIAINGVIGASALIELSAQKKNYPFHALLPPQLIRPGKNDVSVLLVSPDKKEGLHLLSATQLLPSKLHLDSTRNPTTIIDDNNRHWDIKKKGLRAQINRIAYDPAAPMLSISGWALRTGERETPDRFALFINGVFQTATSPNQTLDALVNVFGHTRYRHAGFIIQQSGTQVVAPLEAISIYALFNDNTAQRVSIPAHWYTSNPDFRGHKHVYTQPLPKHTQVVANPALRLHQNEKTIVDEVTGKSYKIEAFSHRSSLSNIVFKNNTTVFIGWAINLNTSQPADSIVIFRDGQAWHQSPVWHARSDVSTFFNDESFLYSGFLFRFSSVDAQELRGSSVRIFALSASGRAAEFKYPENYPWEHN